MTLQELKTHIRGLPLKQQAEIERFVHGCCAKEKARMWEAVVSAIREYEDVYGDIIFQTPNGLSLIIEYYEEDFLGKFGLVAQDGTEERE